MIRLNWRSYGVVDPRPLNIAVVVAALLASLAAGFMGGLIVWALWRYDLLYLGDPRREP
jgi:hypothetical protein